MVQSSFHACALSRSRDGGKMYLNQLGTDQLEIDFNCDALNLCQRLQHVKTLNAIIEKHPKWKKCHGKRLGKYSFTSRLDRRTRSNVNLHIQWVLGKQDACKLLGVNPEIFNAAPGCSMLRPNRWEVGVTADTEREEAVDVFHHSIEESGDFISTGPEQVTEENKVLLDFIGYKRVYRRVQ